jgi:ribonuclease HI
MGNLTVYIDGASKGNPGKASIGIVIYSDNNKILKKFGTSIGNATNNTAEYMALITVLIECLPYHPEQMEIRSDSLLLVRQMQGRYRVKDAWLQKLQFIASRLISGYKKVVFTHIQREGNKEADKIANEYIGDNLF